MRTRYIQIDGELVKVSSDWTPEPRVDIHIIPDIKPYKSMLTGEEITSRSRHREHLKAHGCVEVGNDSSLWKRPGPLQSPPGLKEEIIRVANEKLRS